jgi:AcrR family transcriptional regulator
MGSQRRGEETRSRILEAAAEDFARYGYDGTGVAQICQHAGVTKGAFYHHFPSKQAVFMELLDRWLATLDAQFAAIRADAASVPEGLLRMAGMVRQVFVVASGRLPMFLEFWNRAARDPTTWQATIAPYRRYQAFFSSLIQAGIAEGTLRPCEPDKAARVIVSLAVGLILQGVLDPDGADWGQAVEESVHMLLKGLENPQRHEDQL